MLLWAFSSTVSMFFHQNCQEGHHKPKTPIGNGLFYNFRMAYNKKDSVEKSAVVQTGNNCFSENRVYGENYTVVIIIYSKKKVVC